MNPTGSNRKKITVPKRTKVSWWFGSPRFASQSGMHFWGSKWNPKPPGAKLPIYHYQGGSRKQSHPSKQHIRSSIPWLHDKSPTKIHIIIHVDYIICLTYMDYFILTKQTPIQKSILSLQNIHISYTFIYPLYALKKTSEFPVSCDFPLFRWTKTISNFSQSKSSAWRCHQVTSGETHVSWATKKKTNYYFPLNPVFFFK